MKRNDMVYKLAEYFYENKLRNEFMPSWNEAPSIYVRGCLNDAHMWLQACEKFGMLPPKIEKIVKPDDGSCQWIEYVSEWEKDET